MSERHRFRAEWHDYNGGIYFITICTALRQPLLGRISCSSFYPTELGKIVDEHINSLPSHYHNVEVWNYVVMPNHIHLVISVGTRLIPSAEATVTNATKVAATSMGCLKGPRHAEPVSDFHHNSSLATIIGAFKAGVTRTARTRLIASLPVWQSRYYEHIIRNQWSFDNIMNYIDNNVADWAGDCFYEK